MKMWRRIFEACTILSVLSTFYSEVNKQTVAWAFLIPSNTKELIKTRTTKTTTNSVLYVQLNPLLSSIQPSKTVEIFSLVKEMQAAGNQVTSLSVGEPDFDPPQAVKDALLKAIGAGNTRYTAVTGTVELRQAISRDLQRRKGVEYNPQTEIVVANGAKQAVYQGILATVGVGDKVIVPAPYWPSYPEMVKLAGGTPIILDTSSESGFLMDPKQLRDCLETHGGAVKLLILCNPSNPTGGVYRESDLEELVAVLQDFPQVVILADEIYERLVYYDSDDSTIAASTAGSPMMASMPGMWNRTMTINGFSKAFAMTGLRLGYMAAPAPLARACTTLQSQFTSCASSVSQAAGVAALEEVSDEELDANVQIMKSKRDYVLEKLQSMAHVTVEIPPMGAFYVLCDVSHYCQSGLDDTQFCLNLLREQSLALVPGSSFGAPGTVRISYATSLEELGVAMEKLQAFLEQLK